MIKTLGLTLVILMLTNLMDAQQIAIPRIDMMPDLPQPYLMRNWKQVAQGYDSLVFDKNLTGLYLPVVFFRESNENYPNHSSFGLHTAIGTSDPNSGEAINVIPAVISASLVGIDKSDQFGQNWALMCEEFFNKRSEENIYLNHPSTSSGNDWWYETMPNVFFLQLNYLYPHLGDFDYQVETVANQWLAATELMGGSATPWNIPEMNYRAWNMSTMTPLETGVKEPEAAGAIAWILYNAYKITGNRKYLTGAEWSLEYLNSYSGNPSYELQLPYGVYAAARINAEIGTDYDIEKMVNWCFNRGELREWGAIVGKWGDHDCSGLIGEANDGGDDYAFAMNGFEQAGALVPMVRYDDRFATAIAKWVLNMSNASRLFYPNYLPDDMQDNEDWSNIYDPNSYIAYESMKELKNGKSPYATGDAMTGGWASTNLMLYSSSHAGILGGIIETTNIEGILRLDLLKTDYYKNDAYPTYLYYNPYATNKSVDIILPVGSYDLYNAISNSLVISGVSGNTTIAVPSKESVMLVIIPTDSSITTNGKKTYAGNIIIDFNNQNTISDYPPRIQALTPNKSIIETNSSTKVYCTANDPEQEILTYEWTIDGVTYDSSDVFEFTTSAATGIYAIKCKVSDPGNLWDTLSTSIEVVEKIMLPPEILKIEANPRKIHLSESISVTCLAQDANNDELDYKWTSIYGIILADGNSATYTAPDTKGNYHIVCSVTDVDGMNDIDSIEVMVRDLSVTPSGNVIAHYPMNGNALDASGNALHGISGGVSWINDKEGSMASSAYFDGINDYVNVPNNDLLNFQNAISIACWINIERFVEYEQHPISHGSWQNRYKISISNNKIRFTLKTLDTTKDLDSETKPLAGQWHHLAAVYDGGDMELWLDGKLDAFTSLSGLINKTSYDLVFGQHLPKDNTYNFNGTLDAVSIYDYALSEAQILDHMNHSIDITSVPENLVARKNVMVYPNPISGNNLFIKVQNTRSESIAIIIFDMTGKQVTMENIFSLTSAESTFSLPVGVLTNGMYILSISYRDKVEKELISISR
jgi:hypothetical protein